MIMSTPELFLWYLGIPSGLLVIVVVTWGLEWILWKLGAGVDHCQDALSEWPASAHSGRNHKRDQRAFLNWLHQRSGMESPNARVDERLVEAQRQGELVRTLVEEEVPKAILRCNEIHRLFAQVSGAFHMSEIAFEPECHESRAMSVWLLSHAVEFLENYPLRLEDSRLLHNSVVLRKRALPTCRRCPYIQLLVEQAPRLCPTAELAQIHRASI